MEITKLKQRVKKLERRNKVKVLKLRRLQKVGTAQRIDTSDDTVIDDVSNQGRMINDMDTDVDVVLEEAKEVVADNTKVDQDSKVDESVDIQGSMHEDESEPTEVQEVVDVVTTAKLITEVVTVTSTTITVAKVLVPTATITVAAPKLTAAPSKRRKGVVIRDLKESTTTTSIIIHSEAKSKDKGKGILVEEPKPLKKQAQIKQDEKYQALKRKPQTEAQARKNMMIYLKNVAGFKMDYFKGMSYDDIQKAAKRQKLDEEVEELKRHLQIVPNEDDVYTKATLLSQKLYEVWLRKDLLQQSPTLGAMFEKPDIHAQIWKNQRSVHGLAKVKERKYPLIRFTLDQMLNTVRLEVEEESEVSFELLSFRVDVAKEFKKNMLSV
nr:hypothetical protein [Tanacetum cinerariifolium]